MLDEHARHVTEGHIRVPRSVPETFLLVSESTAFPLKPQ